MAGIPLLYTRHALVVLREREILKEWVERVVYAPAWVEPDPSLPEVQRRFGRVPERDNRILRVVCVESAGEIRIISAFLDRGAKPK